MSLTVQLVCQGIVRSLSELSLFSTRNSISYTQVQACLCSSLRLFRTPSVCLQLLCNRVHLLDTFSLATGLLMNFSCQSFCLFDTVSWSVYENHLSPSAYCSETIAIQLVYITFVHSSRVFYSRQRDSECFSRYLCCHKQFALQDILMDMSSNASLIFSPVREPVKLSQARKCDLTLMSDLSIYCMVQHIRSHRMMGPNVNCIQGPGCILHRGFVSRNHVECPQCWYSISVNWLILTASHLLTKSGRSSHSNIINNRMAPSLIKFKTIGWLISTSDVWSRMR